MKSICVLYIALGNYVAFWPDFYASAKKHFFIKDNVHYFVFSDNPQLSIGQDVTLVPTKNYGWPGNSLYRFSFFSLIGTKIEQYDYAFFFNANALFVDRVDEEILPQDKGCHLIAAQHFRCIERNPLFIGYERRKASTACVKWGLEGKYYCQASIIGATGKAMTEMSRILAKNIYEDEKNGICAKWHDESHFNKYISEHKTHYLSVSYAYCEPVPIAGYKPIIIMRNKENIAPLASLRSEKRENKGQIMLEKGKHFLYRLYAFSHFFEFLVRRKRNLKERNDLACK